MGEKQPEGEKKNEGGEKKSDNITVVLKFDMHCEGCAKKVRKAIKKLDGVEDVKTDFSANKLTVIGKVDPIMIKEKVEEKIKKKVELVSPQPSKPAKEGAGGGDEKKSDDKKPADKKPEGKSDEKKSEEKPKELPVSTVVLKTRVHCEGCAQRIRKIVSRCEGVQDVNVDLQKDLITVKGTMNMKDVLPYLNLKLKRTVDIVPTKKDEGKPKEGGGGSGGGTEKPKEGGGGSEKGKGAGGDKKEGGGDKKEGGGDKKDGGGEKKDAPSGATTSQENATRIEVNKFEYNPYNNYGYSYAYDPSQQQQGQVVYGHQEYWHAPEFSSHPPQMFSDENPNACSVM